MARSKRSTSTSPTTSYRCLREALSNIAHHAQAGHVRVAVSVASDVTLTVSDDGIGVPAEVLGGRGLTNMAERARDLGGDFTISPEPSGGSAAHLAGAGPTVTTAGMIGPPSEDDQGSLGHTRRLPAR